MKISSGYFQPGKTYILAISGGVDSMSLLDLIASDTSFASSQFIVAHFDHRMRSNSDKDADLVAAASAKHGYMFQVGVAAKGSINGEEAARMFRYAFLRKVMLQHGADAVVTAHHQDDVVETMFINIIRGTNRRGLSSLQSHADLLRPLLGYSKQEIMVYAAEHAVNWFEDETNNDTNYLRNWVRASVMPKLVGEKKEQLLKINQNALEVNKEIDEILHELVELSVDRSGYSMRRHDFIMLPSSVAREYVAAIFRRLGIEMTASTINRAWLFIKVGRVGAVHEVPGKRTIILNGDRFTIR